MLLNKLFMWGKKKAQHQGRLIMTIFLSFSLLSPFSYSVCLTLPNCRALSFALSLSLFLAVSLHSFSNSFSLSWFVCIVLFVFISLALPLSWTLCLFLFVFFFVFLMPLLWVWVWLTVSHALSRSLLRGMCATIRFRVTAYAICVTAYAKLGYD